MSLDLSPAPGAAPARVRVARHALLEATLLLRNGEQLLLALVIPIGILVVGRLAGARVGLDPELLPASVLALALFSTAFTSLAIMTGFDRRQGVLERLAATPLSRTGLILGKIGALLVVVALQLVLLTAVAYALGWRPAWGLATLIAAVTGAGGIAAFAAFGLLMAGTLRAEITLGLANLVYLLLLAGGGIVIPLSALPAGVRPLISCLPTAAVAEAFRAASAGTVLGWPLLVVAIWAIAGILLARKAFRWMS